MTQATIDVLLRGCVDVVSRGELEAKLANAARSGRPLRVKLGVDPTTTDLHLGPTVPLRKLRAFQDAGHLAVLIIGDYTAQVGDPSGQNVTRPTLTEEQVQKNAATYLEQIEAVLDPSPAKLEIVYNGSWFAPMRFMDVLRLVGKATVAQMLERDDFSKRYREGARIGLHEFIYPLMQGWDSVEVRADVELGGTDQLFNLLVGRNLQRDAGQEAQVVLTFPLLVGLDGTKKMSKSYGNAIPIVDALQAAGLASSKSDARRKIEGKGVRIIRPKSDGDYDEDLANVSSGIPLDGPAIVRSGRHFVRFVPAGTPRP